MEVVGKKNLKTHLRFDITSQLNRSPICVRRWKTLLDPVVGNTRGDMHRWKNRTQYQIV